MGVTWLLALLIATSVAQHPDEPDITMLYKGNQQTCVAGPNTEGYGMTFMDENSSQYTYANDFEYKSATGEIIDTAYDCDFDADEWFSCRKKWNGEAISFETSSNKPISPIIDERWNKFPIYRTDGRKIAPPKYDKYWTITSETFFIRISVRGTHDAHILLCSSKYPKTYPCYWIILDGFTDNKDMTGIRKCTDGVPDKWATEKEAECKKVRNSTNKPEKLLHGEKWTHFLVSKENGNLIRLWLWDIEAGARLLLEYIDDSIQVTHLFLRAYNALADWKVHANQHLNMYYTNKIYSLGPPVYFRTSSSVCISLYVTLCSKCVITLLFEKEGGISMQSVIEGNNSGPFSTWTNIKMKNGFSDSSYTYYQLYATLKTADGSTRNTYWAIDNFRKCSNDEIRVAAVNSYTKLTCRSLKYPEWTFSPDKQIKNNEPPVCSNLRNFGRYCNISCYTLTATTTCEGYKICLTSQERSNMGACTCSPGYTWSSGCSQICSTGFYGYNCDSVCGKCFNSYCHYQSGECRQGCENGYIPPYCQESFPRLKYPLIVIKEYFTSITLKFDDITVEGSEDIVSYVRLECKTKYTNWKNCSDAMKLILGQEVSIVDLSIDTSFQIRAVIYTNNGNAYRNEDLPITNANTACRVDRNINITINSMNATVFFELTDESCSLESYTLELKQNNVQIKPTQIAYQNMKLLDLTPYTDYDIIITNNKHPNYINKKRFKTEQDAPSEIINLSVTDTSDTEIILSWNEPRYKNGIIQRYTVTYELKQRIGCNMNLEQQIKNIFVNPSDIGNVRINSLQPYSVYQIQIIAETILPGKQQIIQCNTSMIDNIAEDELPDAINTSNLNANTVTVFWQDNCLKQKGPLYYYILFKCIEDEWCHTIPDIILDNQGLTTHELTPFTHYSIELRAKRSQTGQLTSSSRTINIFSSPSRPPPVRNLTVFSRNITSISLRWLDPYPPHGLLEHYNIKYCSPSCKASDIKISQLSSCNLWNGDYKCYVLTNLWKDNPYTITVKAKNKDSKLYSEGNILKTVTTEDKPSAPLNLTHEWNKHEIKLKWNHPFSTNGQLKRFIITLTQNETEIINQDKKQLYNYEYILEEEMKNYVFSINKSFPFSSTYTVTVCAVNSQYGESTTLLIDTPPETPELNKDITIKNDKTTNTSVTLVIPSAKKNTKSKDSFLYVVISKLGKRISKREIEENSLKQVILEGADVQNSWIAIEKILNDEEFVVEIGNDNKIESLNLNEQIHNKKLEPLTEYKITVVLINKYRSQTSSKYYSKNVQTAATIIPNSSALYALLLLLLLPIIGFFIYRYVFKKDTRRTSVMMIPRLRVGRTEDHHEPDVIPLTEAVSEAENPKPKKVLVVPKPGSNKPPENSPPAEELNSTGTTLFHSRMVLLENLEDYLKEALETGELNEQHALFPRGQTKPWDYGMLKQNKFKNRYNNLIAYDKNRVKLEKINNDQYSDYINASYIHGYRQDKAYIATQGPKLATVNDFWRMIWQEKTQYIVMLANVVEAGKKKCEKYWPDIDTTREYGNVKVHFVKSELYADYEFRSFELSCKSEKRKVTHLHFTSWPDHGVPLYPQSLVPFLKKMLTIRQNTAPIVVHCSAGVGRTGTIILCDICLRMAAREKAIDVLRYLHEIREQRANMVDNIDQYKLVHMVLLECLLAPDTNIPCNAELSSSIQKLIEEGGLQIQLNYLQQSSWHDKALNFTTPKQQDPVNEQKNRFKDIVPSENQVYISRYPVDDESSDYINAVPVDGFRFKEQFIVTQLPMPGTVKDFWRMIAEKSVKIIVCLNDIPANDQTCCKFWPAENEEMKPIPNINLKYHKLQNRECYDIHSIILSDKASKDSWMVQLVQFKNWKHENKLPSKEDHLVTLWEETEDLSHGNYPMVVTCYDGATACGIFVAMSFIIEKIKLEQQCDPCLAVRVIRRNRKQFIANKVQFEFLYRSAVIYLSMFETYSNFQPVINKQN